MDSRAMTLAIFIIQLVACGIGIWTLRRGLPLMNSDAAAKKDWLCGGVVLGMLLPFFLICASLDELVILRCVATFDFLLLSALVVYTGGPTQSWFTPYLFALISISTLLEKSKNQIPEYWAWYYSVAGFIVFFVLLFWLADSIKNLILDPSSRGQYHKLYFWTTVLTVFFPVWVGLGMADHLLRGGQWVNENIIRPLR